MYSKQINNKRNKKNKKNTLTLYVIGGRINEEDPIYTDTTETLDLTFLC